MKNGYYISTYLHIDEMDSILNIRIRHDQSIALWLKTGEDITLVHYWELERITGIKMHDIAFKNVEQALGLIDILLNEYGLTRDDIVEIWGTPAIDTENIYHSLSEHPSINYHSICHLFSAILSNSNVFFQNKIIGLAVDGGPDAVVDKESLKKKFYAGCYVDQGKISIFHIDSPAQLWYYARKRYNIREGTLMALASASKSEAYDLDSSFDKLNDFSSFVAAFDFVNVLIDKIESFSEKDIGIRFNYFDGRFTVGENKISMVIKEIQKVSVRMMENNINKIVDKFGIETERAYLSISGGYALNCPTNSFLMKKFNFLGFLSPPCVSDTGIALGVGLYAFNKKMKDSKFRFNLAHPYYGNKDNDLDKIKYYENYIKDISKIDYKCVAEDIIKSPIVWFNGFAEIGPRALGNRSLLGDSRSLEMKDKLNKIKQREWWRPIAPIVLEENVNEWFEDSYASPFMLNTFYIKDEKRFEVPSILHLDLSARVQTINENDNKDLYHIVKEFEKITGIPMICNTSLNDKGEPIINSIDEVFNFALRKKIAVIYLNRQRIELCNYNLYKERQPSERPFKQMFMYNNKEDAEILKQLNPYDLQKDILLFYRKTPELRERYNIKDKNDVRKLKIYIKMIQSLANKRHNSISIYED